jgi:hypothetical protein
MLDTVDVATLPPLVSTPVQPEPAAPAAVRWSLATRIGFRFCLLYFTLYVLTTQMLGGFWIFPKIQPPDMGATGWMLRPIDWTATHVFHVTQYIRTNTGSGDKVIDWIHAFLLLVFSIAATAIWSAVDRRRPNYISLHKWFHVFLRFAAGTTMVGYGMAKASPLQMPAPSLSRLLEQYGDFSPMGVLWASVGASFAYERFTGVMELMAAGLLFVPRLSMLGAMVLVADSIQIFTLNMTYDVPVKLFSFHLIVMGLVLLAPDMRRLTDMLILNRIALPSAMPPLARRAWLRRLLFAAQIVFGAYVVGSSYVENRTFWNTRGFGAPKPPLYGIWTIEKMTINGVERAPLVTDWERWRRIVIQVPTATSYQRMDGTMGGFPTKVDTATKTIAFTAPPVGPPGNGAPPPAAVTGKLIYEQPSPDVLILTGEDPAGRKLHLETQLFDRNKFLLVSRGFNWIQDRPFNR